MSVDHYDDVAISLHARRRWSERTDEDAPHPIVAWIDGHRVTVSTPAYRNCDELRYHRETNMVLLRKAAEVSTVLRATPEDLTSEQGQDLLAAVEAQFGAVEDVDGGELA